MSLVSVPLDDVVRAARDLAAAGRWEGAARLIAEVDADERGQARLALASAEIAIDAAYFGWGGEATTAVAEAERRSGALDRDEQWDLAFQRLRLDYFVLLRTSGTFGPAGKDPEERASIRRYVTELRDGAPDKLRQGWAEFYLGLTLDNLDGDRGAAPAHYHAALAAGESGDDLLTREALRHLGDHDHDDGNAVEATARWERAAEAGARAGAVPAMLSQQMLLAVLARDRGDEAGAVALATEIERWAAAIGAGHVAEQASAFLRGIDPTAPPPESA
jgi:hypothetical protein